MVPDNMALFSVFAAFVLSQITLFQAVNGQNLPRLYPYGLDIGDSLAPQGDDSFAQFDFETAFPFANQREASVFVNTNGALSNEPSTTS